MFKLSKSHQDSTYENKGSFFFKYNVLQTVIVIDTYVYCMWMIFIRVTFYCLPLSSLCKTTHRHWIHIIVFRVSCGGAFYMHLVLSITFYFHCNMWGCMCSTGPFQYKWFIGYIYSSCNYHHQIGSIHRSHCYHIFPWLCAWDVCYIIFCHLLHIRSGKTGNLFSLLLCSLWWVQIFEYVLACRSYSFVWTVHHLIIIIVQTYLKELNL